MLLQNRRLIAIVGTVGFLLLIPFVAMQFTNEVMWTSFDFIVAGSLLLSTGLLGEFIMRNVKTRINQIALCLALLTILILIWLELAVGIFGTPFAGH